jgi:hypothetical protein
VVWEWINPIAGFLRGKPANVMFRAHRYAPGHAAFLGHNLDPSEYAELNRSHGLMS